MAAWCFWFLVFLVACLAVFEEDSRCQLNEVEDVSLPTVVLFDFDYTLDFSAGDMEVALKKIGGAGAVVFLSSADSQNEVGLHVRKEVHMSTPLSKGGVSAIRIFLQFVGAPGVPSRTGWATVVFNHEDVDEAAKASVVL